MAFGLDQTRCILWGKSADVLQVCENTSADNIDKGLIHVISDGQNEKDSRVYNLLAFRALDMMYVVVV